jgi:uncharacterized membrane protein
MFHSISEFFTNATYQASISLEFVRCLPFIVIEFSVMMGCVTSTDIGSVYIDTTYQALISLEFVRCLPFIVIEFSVMMGCVTSTDIGSALTAALLFKKSYAVE